MSFEGCTHIFFVEMSTGVFRICIVRNMYLLSCIYIYARGCTFFGDIISFVRTWMRFMMFDVFVLHMDASSLGCWARGCPCVFYVMQYDVCMIRHVDSLWIFMFYVYGCKC